MRSPAQVNVSEVVADSSFGGFQLGLCILCGLCLIMDGFDVQAMGYVAPAILKEWHVPNAQFGPVFGAGLFGILVGSLLFSMLADKIGRRPVLIGVALCFSVLTFLTARAANVQQMLVIRFLAGTALGGIMPNAVALVGEYSPRKLRVTIMMIVGNGFTAGAAFGGFLAAWLIPRFGWRSVFYFGAVAPLIISAIMIVALPESLQFLVLHGKRLAQAGRWLKRIDPSVASDTSQYFVEETKRKGVPWVHLFHEGRGLGTIFLWIINFMNLLNLYFLASWLPTVANQAGYGIGTSVLVGTMEQLAGMIGGFTLGLFVQRWGFVRVLTTCFALGCINIALDRTARPFTGYVIHRGVPCRVRSGGRTNRGECSVRDFLSHRFASHWNRRGTGHRANRGDHRTSSRRRPDEPAFAFAKAISRSRRAGVCFRRRDAGHALGVEGADTARARTQPPHPLLNMMLFHFFVVLGADVL